MPKARKKTSPNISYRHRPSAPSYQLSIAFKGDVTLSRHNHGSGYLSRFSWHIGGAAVDANPRRRKAVSAVVDRDAFEQHDVLWASRRPVLAPSGPVSSECINGYRQLFDQDSI